MSSQPTSTRRPATRHARVVAALTLIGAFAAGLPSAFAQTESTVATSLATTQASTTIAAAGVSSTLGSSTTGSSLGNSTGGIQTTVAPIKSGKVGAKVVVYKTASTAKPLKTLINGKNVKGRVVFTVIENQGAWLKVYAPVRPNGAIGYVKAADIAPQFTHNWRIQVELGARKLTVYKGDQVMAVETVAVGAKKTPTPLGNFYTVDLLRPKGGSNGAYGAFAYGISGFSNVYQKFGAGDGRIGIHGTNAPALLGQAVTNGCIRLSNAGITKLKEMLPLGVPVNIVA